MIGVDPVLPEEDPPRRIGWDAERPHPLRRLASLMERSTKGDLGHECCRGSGLDQLTDIRPSIELKRFDFPVPQCGRAYIDIVESRAFHLIQSPPPCHPTTSYRLGKQAIVRIGDRLAFE